MALTNIFRNLIFIVTISTISTLPAIADVSYTVNEVNNDNAIVIYNTIKQEDIGNFKSIIKQLRMDDPNIIIRVDLNSNGGDVDAALKIGRIMRKTIAMVAVVPPNSICASACVFVLAGAANRIVTGKVGIHRPYDPDNTNISAKSQKQKYYRLAKKIKDYLSEMNVQPKLYDDMIYISPENIKILSTNELQLYGLGGNDPYIEEATSAGYAKQLGISRQELARRMANAEQKCNKYSNNDYSKCYQDILEGWSDVIDDENQ
jgi:hypothetical protein